MESWEALDVDDSDLPSLLRPCKRLHRHQSPISSTTLHSQPLLEPSSNSSETLQFEEEDEAASNTPLPPSQNHRPQNFRSDSGSTSRNFRSIPGPAGAVQSAMLQKIRDRENLDLSSADCDIGAGLIPTQEYIKRAVENDAEFDDDFTRDPWLSALQYIGTLDHAVPGTPLKQIKEYASVGKLDQVVAVIKSCSQNSRGGLMVTLKDPTGTIGAYIHHKVLNESYFAKSMRVGSVLVLQKVSVFFPSKSVQYLNIMLRNVVKVVTKDFGLLPEENASAKSAIHGEDVMECSLRAGSPEKICSFNNRIRQELHENNTNRGASSQATTGESLSSKFSEGIRRLLNTHAPIDKESPVQQPDALDCLSDEAAKNITGDSRQGLTQGDFEQVDDLQDKITSKQETGGGKNVEQHRQAVDSSASLAQWTDEQLAELFAGDDMDYDI